MATTASTTLTNPSVEAVRLPASPTKMEEAVKSHVVYREAFAEGEEGESSKAAGSGRRRGRRSTESPPSLFAGHSGATTDAVHCSKSFVHSLIAAYNTHHPLVLRPDDVWMAIQTQFSRYVQANSEALRETFVQHEGKKELEVIGGGTLFTANYAALTLAMLEAIRKNIKDATVADWITPDFTTTTDDDRVAASMTAMATMQGYFEYKMSLRCGLPSVTLLGTVADWENVRSRVDRLPEFDLPEVAGVNSDKGIKTPMATWAALLAPVLDQFVATAKGENNMEWWQRVCHHSGGGSGPSFISGWCSLFSVFNEDGKWQGDTFTLRRSRGTSEAKSEWPVIDVQDLAPGVVTCPVTVDDNGTIYKTKAFAGHFGYAAAEGGALQPRIDWCLALTEAELEAVRAGAGAGSGSV